MNYRQRYAARIRRKSGDTDSTRGGRLIHNSIKASSSNVARSMQEVADILGCSRQAVHQVERNALHKLRVALLPALREINPELAAHYEK